MPARHSTASVSPRPSTIYGRHAVLATSLQSIYSRITAQPERALGRGGQVEQTGNRNMADFQLNSTQLNRELRAQVSDTFKFASSLYTIINNILRILSIFSTSKCRSQWKTSPNHRNFTLYKEIWVDVYMSEWKIIYSHFCECAVKMSLEVTVAGYINV